MPVLVVELRMPLRGATERGRLPEEQMLRTEFNEKNNCPALSLDGRLVAAWAISSAQMPMIAAVLFMDKSCAPTAEGEALLCHSSAQL